MRKIVLLFFFIITCAELSAQNYYLRSLDLDTGLNNSLSPYFNKITKECVMISSSLLLDTGDTYNKIVFKNHFTKFDTYNNKILDSSFILNNSSIRVRGTIKLLQGGYLGFGLYYDSKSLRNKTAGIPGCIIRYNENGDTVFIKKYPYRKDISDISSLLQTKDSSIIMVSLLSDTNGSFSVYNALRVIKLNPDFTTSWDSLYYLGYKADVNTPRTAGYFNAITKTLDNGFLIGTSKIVSNADTMYYSLVFKIDSNGRFLWEKTFYGNENEYSGINKIINLRDGNYLLVGSYNSYYHVDPKIQEHVIVIKMNGQGQVIWKKLISVLAYQFVTDVDEFSNGNILLAGQSDILNINIGYKPQAALICLNNKGNVLWSRQYEVPSNKAYGQIDDVNFSEVEIATDKSILAFGNIFAFDSTFPYNNGWNQDFLFLHADSLGCIMPGTCPFTEIEQTPVEPNYFYAYPNPTSSTISFKSNLTQTSAIQIKIINALGQVVLQKIFSDFNESIDVSDFAKGIYFVELSVEEYLGREKVVIE